jgi:hypothetical protein
MGIHYRPSAGEAPPCDDPGCWGGGGVYLRAHGHNSMIDIPVFLKLWGTSGVRTSRTEQRPVFKEYHLPGYNAV